MRGGGGGGEGEGFLVSADFDLPGQICLKSSRLWTVLDGVSLVVF